MGGGAPPAPAASGFLLQAQSNAKVRAGRKKADLLYREFMEFSHLKNQTSPNASSIMQKKHEKIFSNSLHLNAEKNSNQIIKISIYE
jgi:hypothetical protein